MITKIGAVLLLLTLGLMADQKTFIIPVDDGKAQTAALDKELKSGWRVVTAIPVTNSTESGVWDKTTRPTYTTQIVFILTNDPHGQTLPPAYLQAEMPVPPVVP